MNMLHPNERKEIIEKINTDCQSKNVNCTIFDYICNRYEEKNVLNTYGDIFYIQKYLVSGLSYSRMICKRILWSLGLSSEYYMIEKTMETDSDGDYAGWDFYIKQLSDDEVIKYGL